MALKLVKITKMISKAQQGDTQAMSSLIREYQDLVYGFLVKLLGDRSLAQDVTQDCFVKAMRSLSSYSDQGNFKAWLFRIARNTALDQLKKSKRRGGEHLELMEDSVVGVEMPTDVIANREECALAMELLARLPVAEREVMTLRALQNLKFKEIAEITGSPLNTVLGRMRNATNKMKRWMENYQ